MKFYHYCYPLCALANVVDISTDNLYTTIPKFHKNYKVSLDIKPLGTVSDWASILTVGLNEGEGVYGGRTPALFFDTDSLSFVVCSAINGLDNNCFRIDPIPLDQWTTVIVQQAQQLNEEYLYSISIDGEVVFTVVNADARDFEEIKVYAGDPSYGPANAVLRNIEIITGDVVDCDTGCSETCGGGTEICQRTCGNGIFGDDGCTIDQETKHEVCDENDCVNLCDECAFDSDCGDWSTYWMVCGSLGKCVCGENWVNENGDNLDGCEKLSDGYLQNDLQCETAVFDCEFTEPCSVTCGGGIKRCERSCMNGAFGEDGCPENQRIKSEVCNLQPCSLKICPNEECWMLDPVTDSCIVIESAECFQSTCTSSTITGTITSKALNLPSSEKDKVMSGERKLYFNDIKEPDCQIIPYIQNESDMIFMNLSVTLGSCGSFVTQEMVGNKSVITFGGVVRYESAPIHTLITFGDATINIHFNCEFDASQHVSTSNTILDEDDIDGHGTDSDGSDPSWQDTFSLDLTDSATEDAVILTGNYVNVVVDWAIDSLHGKAKFMMNECTITQGNYSFPILKNKNCVLDLISMNIENENNDVFVDSSYKFSYRSFSFVENASEVQTFTLECFIMVCIVDENGIPIAEECDLASNDNECASVDDIEGFTYLIDT